jgi:hypothetical protein
MSVVAALLTAGTASAAGVADLVPKISESSPVHASTSNPEGHPTVGVIRFSQKIPGVKIDLRLNGHLSIDDQPYSDVTVSLGLPGGSYHVSARIIGPGGKHRLRGRVSLQSGETIFVTTELDASGRPALTVT